jgi:hypothetical protein
MTWLTPDQAYALGSAAVKGFGIDPITFARDSLRVLWNGKLNIFLVGCGGTGKTSLGQILLDKENLDAVPLKHDATDVRTRGKPNKLERWAVFYDYPGQWKDFEQEFVRRDIAWFRRARRVVVVMCCAYGFHSDWGEKGGFRAQPTNTTTDSTASIEGLLNKCRDNEKYFLRSFLELIDKNNIVKLDMVTAILKQDLWWDRKEEVQNFYNDEKQEQSYAKIVSDFRAKGIRIRHLTYPLSLVRQELIVNVGNSSETIYSQGKYTDIFARGYRAAFFRGLETLIRNTSI